MKKILQYIKVACGVAIFGPLLIAFLSIPLLFIFNCSDGGGSPGTCTVGGDAMGKFLWSMAMMHWVSVRTLLPGLVIAIVARILESFIEDKTPDQL